jgi:hypothetical protein
LFTLVTALRKITAILLLVILVFNWWGYRFFSDFLEHQADVQLEARIENNDYKADQLIEIRIPLNLPYQANWQSFERFDGEIDLDGVHYKYVKRKIYNDSLVLLCLPNEAKQNIEKAKDNYFKIVNDIDARSQKKSDQNNVGFKNIFSEFFVNHAPGLIAGYEYVSTKHFVAKAPFLSTNLHNTPDQPPEF